jgi:hypothetical protein
MILSDPSKHMQPAQCSRLAVAACRDASLAAVASTRPTKRDQSFYACTTVRAVHKADQGKVGGALKASDRIHADDAKIEVRDRYTLMWWRR